MRRTHPTARRFVCAALALAAVVASSSAAAATLQAGPTRTYKTPCAAIAAAKAGDVIEVDAGRYDGDTCAWSTDDLTVRAVGGRAKIDDTKVAVSQKKGIFVITAPNATVEGFELSGAAISAADGNNGAGIRHQGQNLTVRDCYFHDDQDGILGAPPADGQGTVIIERSEFSHNGAGDGYSHNMYLNHYASFTLRYSYSHDANVGHLVKTRAHQNFILYNRLTDETGGKASYELDVPSAGKTYVIGNVIEQASTTQNPNIVSYGEEGGTLNPDTHLFFVGNTVLNDDAKGTFVVVAPSTPAFFADNIFSGPGTVTSQKSAVQKNDFDDSMGDPMFVDRASFDVHLAAGSPCIDQGADPGSDGAQSLMPDHEYVHPLSEEARGVVGAAIDIGAYEYGNTPDAGAPGADGGGPGSDGGAVGPDGGVVGDGGAGGCGCVVGAPAGGALAWLGVLTAAAALAARRRRG